MKTSIQITIDESSEYYNCSCVVLNGAGRFMVPNDNLDKFVCLAVYLARTYLSDEEGHEANHNKVAESLAEEADTLCKAANIIY